MQWKVGEVTVTRIVEIESVGRTKFVLPQATPEAIKKLAWLTPDFANDEGYLKMSIHSLVVETRKCRILVDTCVGNDKEGRGIPVWNGMSTPYLDRLAAAGYPPKSIDTVLCTHLHVDHVGWNTRRVDGAWAPTFEKARYLFGRAEYDYWKARRDNPHETVVFDDSVKPIVDAGLADFIEPGDRISKEVSVFPTPGHSPGHMSVLIRSQGEEAVLSGDVAHHPCQMAHLDWASTFDSDPVQSTHTRRELFSDLAGKSVLVIGGHFNGGHVARDGNTFRFKMTVPQRP
ncbi:MAG TPA: MBL fold metallo-hydrolase [Xanthobacteraceae bacterium]|nr:MBL fold metallo-hydrolase [Xanthobacteraceae bacterium]